MAKTATHRTRIPGWLIAISALALSTIACTLAADSGPPTLAPRISATPPPTIGYATIEPGDLPDQASPAAPALPQQQTTTGITGLMDQMESDRLMAHVRTLQSFYTRHANSAQDRDDRGIGAAKRYIEGEMRAIANPSQGRMTVFGQDFILDFNGVRTNQTNIIAVIPGTELGAGTYVVGAHYDSRSNDDRDATSYAPGANDNGTGVAALIELSRILSQRQRRATIVLVAFAAEEVGRKGSIAFVENYIQANNIDLRAYINVDAIGSQTYANGTVVDDQIRVFSKGPNETSPSRLVARQAEMIVLNYVPQMEIVVQDSLDRQGRYGDHFSFEEKGYPAIRFIEMAENTSYLDATDTIDGVSPGYLRRSAQTLLVTLDVMADGLRPPANITLRENANGTQTLVWADVPGATGYMVALRSPNSMIYQQFEVTQTSVTWDGFSQYVALAVAAKNERGLMGRLSPEVFINGNVTLTGNP
jgi:hypothetical protein